MDGAKRKSMDEGQRVNNKKPRGSYGKFDPNDSSEFHRAVMKRVEEARIGALAQNYATSPAQSMSSSISTGSNLFTHLPQPGHYPLPPRPMTTQVDPSNQTGTAFNKQDIKVSEAKLLRNAIHNERKARDMIKREHKKAMNGGDGQSNEAEKTPVTGGLIIPTGENTSGTVPPSQPSVPGILCINFEADLGKFSVQESLDQLRPILEMVKQVYSPGDVKTHNILRLALSTHAKADTGSG